MCQQAALRTPGHLAVNLTLALTLTLTLTHGPIPGHFAKPNFVSALTDGYC